MKFLFVTFLLFSIVFSQDFFSPFQTVKRVRERLAGRRHRRPSIVNPPYIANLGEQIEDDQSSVVRPQIASIQWPTRSPSQPPRISGSNTKECHCGQENPGKRIVGGLEVDPKNRYPWMALITDKKESLCGGAVINDRYILTAAHCLDVCEESIEDCKVVLGVHNITDAQANVYDIEELVKHDEYQLFLNDIGLIKLKSKIKFSKSVRPICLPSQVNAKEIKPYDQTIMTAGWGLTDNGKASDVLMQFETTDWLKNDKSKSRFCKDLLCLKPGRGRFESGDSGGPAWITVDNKATIIGVVSHYRLHRMRLTRVPLAKEWIMKNTESANYCN